MVLFLKQILFQFINLFKNKHTLKYITMELLNHDKKRFLYGLIFLSDLVNVWFTTRKIYFGILLILRCRSYWYDRLCYGNFCEIGKSNSLKKPFRHTYIHITICTHTEVQLNRIQMKLLYIWSLGYTYLLTDTKYKFSIKSRFLILPLVVFLGNDENQNSLWPQNKKLYIHVIMDKWNFKICISKTTKLYLRWIG